MDKYTYQADLCRRDEHHGPVFYPNFDIVELPGSYKLSGELPGVRKQDIKIEFTGPHTIHIDGVTYATHISDGSDSNEEKNDHADVTQLLEDDIGTGQDDNVAAAHDKPMPDAQQQPVVKFMSVERTVGRFSRTFSFPAAIQESGSKASLKDGILYLQASKAVRGGSERHIISIQ